MMKTTVNFYEFRDAFQSIRPDNFSYEGLQVLFDALEEIEESSGQEMELDVIALCCDFSEMELKEVLDYYDITDEELTDDNEVEMLGLATVYLSDNTFLCGVTSLNTFVFQDF